jgi:hypothetical protein
VQFDASSQENLNVAEGICEPVCELSLSRSLESLCLLSRVLVGPLGGFHFLQYLGRENRQSFGILRRMTFDWKSKISLAGFSK